MRDTHPTLLALALALYSGCGTCMQGTCFRDVEQACMDSARVTVARVIDGDTIEVDPPLTMPDGSENDTVRLLCIDTPESTTEVDCWGPEASEWMTERVEGRTVTLHFAEDCLDIHGRVLAYVRHGGTNLNLALAREGLALPIGAPFDDYPCCAEILTAAEQARDLGLGGWGACSGAPWEL
jgi:micrococcal nuclease